MFVFQLAAVLSVVVRSLTYLMEISSFTSMMMMMMMMTTVVIVMTTMNARDVFAAMESPLSVKLPTVRLFNPSAALTRDRATIMEILLM